ncbi:hypothetical protein AAHE18_17G242700 [Arachis hypogaea]
MSKLTEIIKHNSSISSSNTPTPMATITVVLSSFDDSRESKMKSEARHEQYRFFGDSHSSTPGGSGGKRTPTTIALSSSPFLWSFTFFPLRAPSLSLGSSFVSLSLGFFHYDDSTFKRQQRQPQLTTAAISLSVNKTVIRTSSWVVDTGTTYYICFLLKYFYFYIHVPPIQVHMPDGTIASTKSLV